MRDVCLNCYREPGPGLSCEACGRRRRVLVEYLEAALGGELRERLDEYESRAGRAGDREGTGALK